MASKEDGVGVGAGRSSAPPFGLPGLASVSLPDPLMVIPPLNFSHVSPGIFKSGFPVECNLPFLKQLGLKSILCVCPEKAPDEYDQWVRAHDMALFKVELWDNLEPFISMPQKAMGYALACLLDKKNHPILVHCSNGKNRCGCVVGCLRAIQGWSFSAIFDEYARHTGAAAKLLDVQFIELFEFRDNGLILLKQSATKEEVADWVHLQQLPWD